MGNYLVEVHADTALPVLAEVCDKSVAACANAQKCDVSALRLYWICWLCLIACLKVSHCPYDYLSASAHTILSVLGEVQYVQST